MTRTTDKLLALLLVSACGRRHFDAVPNDGAAGDADLSAGVGCADHVREAFQNVADFPDLAGCVATWAGAPSLRAVKTGIRCGDDLGTCDAPADACDEGWHICGENGDPLELFGNATAAQCNSVGGIGQAFVAAMSHCMDDAGACVYAPPYGCLEQDLNCSEPVCCGRGCGHVQACQDGVYAGETGVVAGGVGFSCGGLPSSTIAGVLCCRDVRTRQSGCADGQREAFTDETTFPAIAGCAAHWTQPESLRAAKTGSVCGDDAGDCAAPADACAFGWEPCGTSGDPTEISSRLTATQCDMQGDATSEFVGAMSHCKSSAPCVYPATSDCLDDNIDCSEPVCCGQGCVGFRDLPRRGVQRRHAGQ